LLSPEESKEALTRLFRRQQVADLDTVYRVLKTTSKMTVFRRLSALGYLTSYNQNGRYYTLADVPEFDADGLWRFQGIFFSRHGSLRATVEQLVQVSQAGQTHPELAAKLQVRVHNTLLQLFHQGRIGRALLESLHLYLYLSTDVPVAEGQVAQRRQLEEAPVLKEAPVKPMPQRMNPAVLIEILLEVIRGARIVVDPATVRQRLRTRSVDVSQEDIETVYRTYGLKKTPD
jgi:hypothetical protein